MARLIISWRFSIVPAKRFIEIAAVAVSDPQGDVFNGKIGAIEQADRPPHAQFQQNLGK